MDNCAKEIVACINNSDNVNFESLKLSNEQYNLLLNYYNLFKPEIFHQYVLFLIEKEILPNPKKRNVKYVLLHITDELISILKSYASSIITPLTLNLLNLSFKKILNISFDNFEFDYNSLLWTRFVTILKKHKFNGHIFSYPPEPIKMIRDLHQIQFLCNIN